MATWTIGGATITSGGKVTGTDEVANDIRNALENGAAVFYLDRPPNSRSVDPKNDWVLHRYLLEQAFYQRLELKTDYVPKDEDIPPDLARQMKELAALPPEEDGTVY